MMPSKPETGRVLTRDRILEAALAEFGSRGYKGTTTKSIARKAGVNEVTIFRLFESKQKLFHAAFLERSLLGKVIENVSFEFKGDLDEVVYNNMRFVLGLLRQNKSVFLMMLGDASRMPELRGMVNDLVTRRAPNLVAPMLQRLMEDGRMRTMDPIVATRAMMGMVQAYFIMGDLLGNGEVDGKRDEKMLRGFVSIFLDGVRAGDGDGQ